MRQQILFFSTLLLVLINQIYCDCGCLKCSKDLQVVSPPYYPYKVIVKGSPCAGTRPAVPEIPPTSYIPLTLTQRPSVDYNHFNSLLTNQCPPIYAYKYKLQLGVVPPPPLPAPITGLVARPDRLVIQKQPSSINCPVYTGDDGACDDPSSPTYRPPCRSIFSDGSYYAAPAFPPMVVAKPGPVVEPFAKINCGCRYDTHHSRPKRDLPILKKSFNFLVGLLPIFLRFPIEETLRSFKDAKTNNHLQKTRYVHAKPSETLFEKLKTLNYIRSKRSLVFDNDKLRLPFLKVTEVEDNDDASSESDEDEEDQEEQVIKKIDPREQYLQPLNFDQLVPHTPIFYVLNAPIRFLHQFHRLGQKISPVFKSVPYVLFNSKKYLKKFGKNLRNDVLNFASDIIGDFDEIDPHSYLKPSRRFKRNLEQFEPEYSLVFGNDSHTVDHIRTKRYILKVVDEDEVEKFLREKLGGIVESQREITKEKKHHNKKEKETSRKKLVVEQLTPKLIIDNKGRPFVEINGAKRPIFLNKKNQNKDSTIKEVQTDKDEGEEENTQEDLKEKISNIITKARERAAQNHNPPVGVQENIPNHVIKDRINEVLQEIQNLVNLNIDKYSKIHSGLGKLECFKTMLVTEWKKILLQNKHNDITSKIPLLNDFKELQNLRDDCVKNIAEMLSSGSNFMTRKLIKMLVRLQKLQCIIYRVIEDFGERIKIGTEFDVRKEVKYVDYLENLHFTFDETLQDLESALKKERDDALKNEMTTLENLRQLVENKQSDYQKLYQEAQILWEIKNIEKLQKDTIVEMNEKISRGQKVRKELKILFDLLKQSENCEEKQKNIFAVESEEHKVNEKEQEIGIQPSPVMSHENKVAFSSIDQRRTKQKVKRLNKNRNFPRRTIIEDKKPVKLVSNGFTMTAYKVSD